MNEAPRVFRAGREEGSRSGPEGMQRGGYRMKSAYVAAIVFLCCFSVPGFPGVAAGAEQGDARFPSKHLTFIVPLPAGGAPDLASRLICKEEEKFLGQPIVVLNKPGASFTVGIAAIASARPDGYTIGYAGHPGMFVAPLTEK